MKKDRNLLKLLTTDVKLINIYLLLGIVFGTIIVIGSVSYALFSYEKTSNNLIKVTAVTSEESLTCYNNGEGLSTSPGDEWQKVESSMTYSANKVANTMPTTDYSVLVSQRTLYRYKTVSTVYSDWSSWSSTTCSGGSDVCESRVIKSERSYSSAGHYTYNYCPNGSGAFQDQSYQYGSYCTWRRWKLACNAVVPSGYSSCVGPMYSYYASQTTTCGRAWYGCYLNNGEEASVMTSGTYNSSASGWEYTTSATTTTSCGSKSGYSLSSREATYRCYNYGSWSDYSVGSCSTTSCLNGYGTCCTQSNQYRQRTKSTVYSDWSSWSTTACSGGSDTCESKQEYTYRDKLWKWCQNN